ncbi:MAG TPA: metallophosphoesterase, partial [Rhodopirellula sp.]|nr:metallophosphoesterase [Rhodopirellula sp.]
MPNLINAIPQGPVDIVGDVHGEIDPLLSLMYQLGYDEVGRHTENRKLVFVGDLTDRGPNSIAVVQLVQELIEADRAQCTLGNHELNILLNQRKHDNGWFFGEEYSEDGHIVPQVLATTADRERMIQLFRTLPIALHREDLRVIHACWHSPMIASLERTEDAITLLGQHADLIAKNSEQSNLDQVDISLAHQNQNPVRRLTSGPEERV